MTLNLFTQDEEQQPAAAEHTPPQDTAADVPSKVILLNCWYRSPGGIYLLTMYFCYHLGDLCVMMREHNRESETTPGIPYYHYRAIFEIESLIKTGRLYPA